MPDLTIEYFPWCKSNEFWQRKVVGSNGREYTVLFTKTPRGSRYEYDYSCDCDAFRFGKGKPCKHIKQVRNERCAWNAEAACGGGTHERPANGRCPKCGGELSAVGVGV